MSVPKAEQGHVAPGESVKPTRLPGFAPVGRLGGRLFVDRLARRLVTLGGVIIIGSILAILIVIAAQVYPLCVPPSTTPAAGIRTAPPLRVGIDEYREVVYAVTESGIEFHSLVSGKAVPAEGMLDLGGARITGVSPGSGDRFALGLSDGRVLPVAVSFDVAYADNKRILTPTISAREPLVAHADGAPVETLAYALTADGPVAIVRSAPRRITLLTVAETTSLMGDTVSEISSTAFDISAAGDLVAMVTDDRGENLFAGTTAGEIIRIDLSDKANPRPVGSGVLVDPAAPTGVTALQFLIGDRTLVVGDARGGVTTWQLLRRGGDTFHLVKVNDFAPHGQPVASLSPSRRDKGFLSMDAGGGIHLNYGTTGKTLLTLRGEGPMEFIAFAPKADGFLCAGVDGTVQTWSLDNRHPEVTWKSLFGKVWYEGYDEPEYVWQSTGGTDDFEAKFSLTPLIYGTLKGTLYALLFAVPVALLGALYASQFMHPDLRSRIKPAVEIMAALPSVVLGFIAGLWLAPYMEKVVPGIIAMPLVVAACILITLLAWQACPTALRHRMKAGREIVILVPVVLFAGWLSFRIGELVEQTLLHGDYRTWLLSAMGLTFDQRNSMVVGFAMGFAVIPIIFTIAEDSLSSVPNHLKAASLALGATPWQTAIRVVLPTASPGIFSAIMIGLGRAVGETMIVLMATGNTPVMNASMFSGFRALSANIAVELPEAPEGGTLFRVLFLAALLLFLLTFVMNTAAELIRLRLRKKYRYL